MSDLRDANDFECLQCATCCRNLLETRDGKSSGMTLTDKEASIFQPAIVSPKIALGMSAPEITILYQLNVKCCPNVNEKNMCQIYEKRPLVCQSFPIISGAISNKCKVFSYRKVGLSYSEPYAMIRQLQASEKLDKYIQNRIRKHFKEGIKLWEYDLTTKQWTCKTQFNNPP
jgi:Fe-S-cluster containining protein